MQTSRRRRPKEVCNSDRLGFDMNINPHVNPHSSFITLVGRLVTVSLVFVSAFKRLLCEWDAVVFVMHLVLMI